MLSGWPFWVPVIFGASLCILPPHPKIRNRLLSKESWWLKNPIKPCLLVGVVLGWSYGSTPSFHIVNIETHFLEGVPLGGDGWSASKFSLFSVFGSLAAPCCFHNATCSWSWSWWESRLKCKFIQFRVRWRLPFSRKSALNERKLRLETSHFSISMIVGGRRRLLTLMALFSSFSPILKQMVGVQSSSETVRDKHPALEKFSTGTTWATPTCDQPYYHGPPNYSHQKYLHQQEEVWGLINGNKWLISP